MTGVAVAHVGVSKCADHLPLYRQEGIFDRHGVTLSRQTMCDWMGRCARLVSPLFDLMKERVLKSRVMQTDDTPVGVLDPALPRTRTGRIWTYVGDRDHTAAGTAPKRSWRISVGICKRMPTPVTIGCTRMRR